MWTRNGRSNIRERMTCIVRTRPGNPAQGLLSLGNCALPCALGKSGITTIKGEGDGATPAGTWKFLEVRYRADRVSRPLSRLPVRRARKRDGWCDTSGDRNYNRPVTLPYPCSAETMWRDDHIYDLVVVLSHNQCPRVRGRGSAIFVHLNREGYTPTQGCLALSQSHLLQLLALCGPGDRLQILAS